MKTAASPPMGVRRERAINVDGSCAYEARHPIPRMDITIGIVIKFFDHVRPAKTTDENDTAQTCKIVGIVVEQRDTTPLPSATKGSTTVGDDKKNHTMDRTLVKPLTMGSV